MPIAKKEAKQQAVKQPMKQKISGVILIDKPKGMTSQQVVSKVKYLFKSTIHDSKKAGHTGTLDPMATGLLPICLGEATKFSHYQLDADKSYQAIILLGSQTDTGDADGKIIDQTVIPVLNDELLKQIAQQFMGSQQQIPPMYSALKKDGKKLYEYARAGIEIERAPRDITIKDIGLSLLNDEQIRLTVTCTKGTYVRVLAEDIAKVLGTLGHLIALRRVQVGHFDLSEAITIAQLEQQELETRLSQLLTVDACINITAQLILNTAQRERIQMGQRLNVIDQLTPDLKAYIVSNLQPRSSSTISSKADDDRYAEYELPVDIRLIDDSGQFLGLGAISLNGRLQPKKVIVL